MAKEGSIPTWGYSAKGDKVFDLMPGDSLPEGFFAHPAMIKGSAADKQMRTDAEAEGLDGHQFERPEQKAPQGNQGGNQGSRNNR